MTEVNFKFDLYERVETPLTGSGIITMLGVDKGGNTYYVTSAQQGVSNNWWPEDQIKIGKI